MQIKTLIAGGILEVKCKSKANTTYKGQFKLGKNDKGYADIIFQMPAYKMKDKKI